MSIILFVCTANICRSPAAEALARARHHGEHSFASAGFLFEDRPAEPDMVKALADVGVDATAHRSRIVTADLAAGADLILTMEARHVQDLTLMSNDIFAKTLPLMEAGERLADRQTTVADFVASLQSRDPLRYLDTRWDVEDPYKRSKRRYRRSVEQIAGLVDAVLPRLVERPN
jgi:protein-tyrosine-phosphatase